MTAQAPAPPAARVFQTVRRWGEMIKFSHSVFALPFALVAMFLAARPGRPTLAQFALILICMVAARSAAMTFNRIVDAAVDARNPRTAARHIPRGVISLRAAWLFFALACGMFVVGAAGFWWTDGNPWPALLSAPVLAVLCAYSFTKRFTRWSHVILGGSIGLAPLAAWIALSPQTLGAPAWLLAAAVLFWIAGFDLIYACQDAEFDRAAGLCSVPARMGVAAALWLARIFHIVTLVALVAVGWAAGLGALYYAGVACVGALLTAEHAIVSPRDLSRVNVAFFTMNGIVGVVFGALAIADILLVGE